MLEIGKLIKVIVCLVTVGFMLVRIFSKEYSRVYCISSIIIILTAVKINSMVGYVILCNLVNYLVDYTKEEHKTIKRFNKTSSKIFNSKEEFYKSNQLLSKGGLVK